MIWQFWDGPQPPYIQLCHKIIANYNTVKLLDFSSVNCDIDTSQLTSIQEKTNVFRIDLLYKHGGIWVDSDAICLRDLSFIEDMLNDYDFICSDEIPLINDRVGHHVIPNGFMASRKNGTVIQQIRSEIKQIIKNKELLYTIFQHTCTEDRMKSTRCILIMTLGYTCYIIVIGIFCRV
jgi:hypothetical protein